MTLPLRFSSHPAPLLATDVEAEVYLIELRITRDGDGPKEFGAENRKPRANICFSKDESSTVPLGTYLSNNRDQLFRSSTHEVRPIRRKKNFLVGDIGFGPSAPIRPKLSGPCPAAVDISIC